MFDLVRALASPRLRRGANSAASDRIDNRPIWQIHSEKYIPLGRFQVAEDLAGTVIFLASDPSAYIIGQTLHVNGG